MSEYNPRFYEMINNLNSVRKYLLSTPFANDPILNFNKELTEDYFFQNFFSTSRKAEEAKDKFYEELQDNEQIALITGYKGCGKTTFINYITRYQRRKIVNFDRFYNTTQPIKSQLVLELYDDICKDSTNQNLVLKSMLKIFYNQNSRMFIVRKIDPQNTIKNFFDKCIEITEIRSIDVFNLDYDDLKLLLYQLEINQLILLVLFWDISHRVSDRLDNRCYIIFDNLDAIHETEELEKLMLEFAVFYNNASFILSRISHPMLTRPSYNAFQDYIFIFAMRETTKATVSEHFNDRAFGSYFYCDVSTLFDKSDFITKKYNFLINNPHINNVKLIGQTSIINQLLEDIYIRDNIFPLFNNDYRTIIKVLTTVLDNFEEESKICNLLRSEYNYIKYGARGILFRKIFNVFAAEGYFDALKSTDVTIPGKNLNRVAINVSRLVLTYLINYANEFRSKEFLQDKPGISLLTIFTDLEPICDLRNVVSALWIMCSLRHQQYWNHLITFDFLSVISFEQLLNEIERYKQNNRNYNKYPMVRISCAGKIYLNTVLAHFEYMAARVFSNEKEPLFLSNYLISEDCYAFEPILEGVLNEVQNCCKKLRRYYELIYCDKEGYTEEEYLGSRFAYHKLDEYETDHVNSMFHGERVIHSHISYIDAFRKYAISKEIILYQKIKINRKIIEFIKKYITIFNPTGIGQPYSGQTKILLQRYNKCIELIERGNYAEYNISVDSQTGKRLLDKEG